MIFLLSDKVLDVDLTQIVPTCDVLDSRVIPLVGEDLRCIHRVVKKATRGVALKSKNKTLITFVRELRPELTLYVWGTSLRRKNTIPILPVDDYRGYGIYYVKNRQELRQLLGKSIEGLLLDSRGFDPYSLELILKNKVMCNCGQCSIVEKLFCEYYKEIEIL
ncbi:MAG: hypothetical protein QW049_01140 [Pyrobaculum sp.]